MIDEKELVAFMSLTKEQRDAMWEMFRNEYGEYIYCPYIPLQICNAISDEPKDG